MLSARRGREVRDKVDRTCMLYEFEFSFPFISSENSAEKKRKEKQFVVMVRREGRTWFMDRLYYTVLFCKANAKCIHDLQLDMYWC